MTTLLTRNDVVDQRIVRVMQTPWTTADGITVCVPYVLLENGLWIEFNYPDDELTRRPLTSAIVDIDALIPAADVQRCEGDLIVEVVASEFWGSFGFLLASGPFVHVGVSGDIVGPFFSVPSKSETSSEYLTYWDNLPLPQWIEFLPIWNYWRQVSFR